MNLILIVALALVLAACDAPAPDVPTPTPTPEVTPEDEKPVRPKPCAPNQTGCERPS
jgi:hypothetical protein